MFISIYIYVYLCMNMHVHTYTRLLIRAYIYIYIYNIYLHTYLTPAAFATQSQRPCAPAAVLCNIHTHIYISRNRLAKSLKSQFYK